MCVYLYIYIYMYIDIHTHMCVYVYVYVFRMAVPSVLAFFRFPPRRFYPNHRLPDGVRTKGVFVREVSHISIICAISIVSCSKQQNNTTSWYIAALLQTNRLS